MRVRDAAELGFEFRVYRPQLLVDRLQPAPAGFKLRGGRAVFFVYGPQLPVRRAKLLAGGFILPGLDPQLPARGLKLFLEEPDNVLGGLARPRKHGRARAVRRRAGLRWAGAIFPVSGFFAVCHSIQFRVALGAYPLLMESKAGSKFLF